MTISLSEIRARLLTETPKEPPAEPVRVTNERGGYIPHKRVYLAGKIAKNDWRAALVPGLREHAYWSSFDMIRTISGTVYAGPYFVGCDHGCSHGPNSHGAVGKEFGCMGDNWPDRPTVFGECLRQISRADLMFVWLGHGAETAYGTYVEIGYAYAEQIPIVVGLPAALARNHAGWFGLAAARTVVFGDTAAAAYSAFMALR